MVLIDDDRYSFCSFFQFVFPYQCFEEIIVGIYDRHQFRCCEVWSRYCGEVENRCRRLVSHGSGQ